VRSSKESRRDREAVPLWPGRGGKDTGRRDGSTPGCLSSPSWDGDCAKFEAVELDINRPFWLVTGDGLPCLAGNAKLNEDEAEAESEAVERVCTRCSGLEKPTARCWGWFVPAAAREVMA
jgi:hypothetical protein